MAATSEHDAWERLGEAVRQRRNELQLRQGQLPPSSATWRKVEYAIDPPYSPQTVSAICAALRWTHDSFDRILAGDAPIVTDDTGEVAPWDELLAGQRQLTAAQREITERLDRLAHLLEHPPEP